MAVERCEGCPLVGDGRKCITLPQLFDLIRQAPDTPAPASEVNPNKALIPGGAEVIAYETECPDLNFYFLRTIPVPQSRGPMDDLRLSDHAAECAERSRIRIDVSHDRMVKARVLDRRSHVLSRLANIWG